MIKTLARSSLVLAAASTVLLSPVTSFAGGGGTGSKSKVSVRVKNTGATSSQTALVAISTVEVGDANNAPISIGSETLGQVATAFRMAKHEVTIAQYAAFLNAVATRSDGANGTIIESLYDSHMASDSNVAGITRLGSGTASSPYVYTVVGDSLKPIAYVDWFSAARFANWMHNGATSSAGIETGAYNLEAGSGAYTPRSPDAKWWIPSENEWFKAAYYKGGGTAAGYWMFPTRSDTLPDNTPSSGSNVANFLRLGVYSVTEATTLDSSRNYLTAVGTFVNAPSAYGTFDQGGNVEEWTDDVVFTSFGASRRTRGGAWNSGGLNDDVDPIPTALPSDRSSKIGFRLARAATSDANPTALSRTFLVKVGGAERSLMPEQVTQYKVNKGEFVVTVTDAETTSFANTSTFNTRSRRTVYIAVSTDGTQIKIEDTDGATKF